MDEGELRKQMMEMSTDAQRAEMVREFKKALVLGGLLAAQKYPTCGVHETEMEWVANITHPDGGVWVCEACRQEEEVILHGTGGPGPLGVIAGSFEEKSVGELEAAARDFEGRLREMYALGAVRREKAGLPEYRSPTKKVKAESKKRRQMAQASRRRNRR